MFCQKNQIDRINAEASNSLNNAAGCIFIGRKTAIQRLGHLLNQLLDSVETDENGLISSDICPRLLHLLVMLNDHACFQQVE